MTLITQSEAWLILAIFGITMISLVYFLTKRKKQTHESFLVASRNVSWFRGAFSIAVSWIWAPAIFIVSLQAYTQGLAGAFWFIIPNIVCFFIFAPLAIRLRKLMPDGYTLPEYMLKRYNNDTKVHLAFLVIFFGYQLGAIIINAVAGGTLLHILTGMDYQTAVLAIAGIALAYSLASGLEASIITDVLQMSMILIMAFILVPWTIFSSGGLEAVQTGLGGVTGEFRNILHPWIVYSFGIVTTLGLISGPIADQMFFQRSFAIKQKEIAKTFIAGGLLFGVVPVALSLLGFIAASPAVQQSLTITDPQMVAPLVIGEFLPQSALILFVLMAFAGLCSTLDSAYCAISSLGTVDVYKKYINPNATEKDTLGISKRWMFGMAIIGTSIAVLQPKLLWIMLTCWTLTAAGFFPIIFSLFWSRLNANGAFLALALSIICGLPLSIYANITENTHLIVGSAIASVSIGLVVCLIAGYTNNSGYSFKKESPSL